MENAAHVPHLIYLFLLELYKMVLNIIKNKNNNNKKKAGRITFTGYGVIEPLSANPLWPRDNSANPSWFFFSLYFFNNF
jgi:hypothetical protein